MGPTMGMRNEPHSNITMLSNWYKKSHCIDEMVPLHWRHNDRGGVSDHQPHDCLLSRLFRRRSKKTSKLRITGLYVGNSLATGEFPAQRASNTENVSIWWYHHAEKQPNGRQHYTNFISHWPGAYTKWSLCQQTGFLIEIYTTDNAV